VAKRGLLNQPFGIIYREMTDIPEIRLIEALKKVDAHGDVAPPHVQDPTTMVIRQLAVQNDLMRWDDNRGRFVLTSTGPNGPAPLGPSCASGLGTAKTRSPPARSAKLTPFSYGTMFGTSGGVSVGIPIGCGVEGSPIGLSISGGTPIGGRGSSS
jgi:hypothetical protein